MRDQAAEHFERHTGSSWRPRSGSMVNHRALTSAMIDSRDFLAAKRRAETEVMLPAGPTVALTGGADFNDHQLVWAKLDKVRARPVARRCGKGCVSTFRSRRSANHYKNNDT